MLRTRLTLDLSPQLNAHVEGLAAAKGISKADVLRLAVEALAVADTARKEGLTVGAWRRDGEVLREQVFIF